MEIALLAAVLALTTAANSDLGAWLLLVAVSLVAGAVLGRFLVIRNWHAGPTLAACLAGAVVAGVALALR
jgi:hypothetical protein